jgi:bla regulator protein blaR1
VRQSRMGGMSTVRSGRQPRPERQVRWLAGLLTLVITFVAGQGPTAKVHAQSAPMPDWQKAAGGKMEFEVASIRLAKPGTFTPPNFGLDNGGTYSFGDPHGRFSADFPLSVYIGFAYKIWLTPEQTHTMLASLPKWVSTDNFVIEARAPGNPTKDQMRLMLQSLLADRFKLAVHFEMQQTPVLALVLEKSGKTGPKLRPHSEGPACDKDIPLSAPVPSNAIPEVYPPRCGIYAMRPGPNGSWLLGSRDTTMQQVANSLPSVGNLGRPVVDKTGLSGTFDFTLNFVRESNQSVPPGTEAQPEAQGPTILEAVQEQLGLKLKPVKETMKILVVDHVEEPSPN